LLGGVVLLLTPVVVVFFFREMGGWMSRLDGDNMVQRLQAFVAGREPEESRPTVPDQHVIYHAQTLPVQPLMDGQPDEIQALSSAVPLSLGLCRFSAGRHGTSLYVWLVCNRRLPWDLELEACQGAGHCQKAFWQLEAQGMSVARDGGGQLLSQWRAWALENSQGTGIEMRMPWQAGPGRLSFRFGRSDTADRVYLAAVGASTEQLLDKFPVQAHERLWLVDENGTVLYRRGLLRPMEQHLQHPFLAWLLAGDTSPPEDPWRAKSTLSGWPNSGEQGGRAQVHADGGTRRSSIRMVAGVPWEHHWLILEGISDSSRLLASESAALLVQGVFAVIAMTWLVLMALAGRLAWRIRRLQRRMHDAFDETGRLRWLPEAETGTDEIADLSQSFEHVARELQAYQSYQERLASRLAHELKTPLAIIQGAMDNLRSRTRSDTDDPAWQRISDAVSRMGQMISRMRAASRLEHSIFAAEAESVDAGAFVTAFVEGWRQTFSHRTWELHVLWPDNVLIPMSRELVSQALDKLLTNADEFTPEGLAIRVTLTYQPERDRCEIVVFNPGSALPSVPEGELLQSMVSCRDSSEGHLGLGLYVVSLVARYHGGRAFIRATADGQGVEAGWSWPARRTSGQHRSGASGQD
jgi:signal transduction histidine kinase